LKINGNNGFTLIEVLVGINLSFIAVTIMVMFFLFAYKYIFSVTKNAEMQSETENFIYLTGQIINRADKTDYIEHNESRIIVTDKNDTLYIEPGKLNLKKLFIVDAEEYNILISNSKGAQINISYPKEKIVYGKFELPDINYMCIEFLSSGKKYKHRYFYQQNSTAGFNNIGDN